MLQRVFHMMVITYSEGPLLMVSPKFEGHTLTGVNPKLLEVCGRKPSLALIKHKRFQNSNEERSACD
jgi:hypothetical protein